VSKRETAFLPPTNFALSSKFIIIFLDFLIYFLYLFYGSATPLEQKLYIIIFHFINSFFAEEFVLGF